MGTFADSLFAVLMSWVRALVNSIWALFSSERTTALEFLGKNWLLIVIVLLAAGLLIDWVVWLVRWKPYTLWAQRARRLLHIAPEEEKGAQSEKIAAFSAAAVEDDRFEMQEEPEADDEDWLPEQPDFAEEDEREALARAQAIPDEELGAYPGMRYDAQAAAVPQDLSGTKRFSAVHQEGPGAAEVSRRQEEIRAYKLALEEEERRERERRLEAQRMEQEAIRREEEERQRKEEARQREEEARAAQEEYERQMAEYERQKAQYERELAQYQRDLAAYEEAIAAENAKTEAPDPDDSETAQELAPKLTGRTRARRRPVTLSDMVEGETVEALPDTPQWPKMDKTVSEVNRSAQQEKSAKKNGFAARMAFLIEPEQEEITGVNALPPRVDPKQAYKPAATPQDEQKRRRK